MTLAVMQRGEKMMLIDADEMLYELSHWKDEKGWYHDNRTDVYHINEIKIVCDRMPTVEERKKGKWVKARGSWCTPGGDAVWECSECGKGIHVYGIEHGTYGRDVADGQWVACPNCGAVMEGEEYGKNT